MEDTEIETKEAEARGKSENDKVWKTRSARFLTVFINLLDCARTFTFTKPKTQTQKLV